MYVLIEALYQFQFWSLPRRNRSREDDFSQRDRRHPRPLATLCGFNTVPNHQPSLSACLFIQRCTKACTMDMTQYACFNHSTLIWPDFLRMLLSSQKTWLLCKTRKFPLDPHRFSQRQALVKLKSADGALPNSGNLAFLTKGNTTPSAQAAWERATHGKTFLCYHNINSFNISIKSRTLLKAKKKTSARVLSRHMCLLKSKAEVLACD